MLGTKSLCYFLCFSNLKELILCLQLKNRTKEGAYKSYFTLLMTCNVILQIFIHEALLTNNDGRESEYAVP